MTPEADYRSRYGVSAPTRTPLWKLETTLRGLSEFLTTESGKVFDFRDNDNPPYRKYRSFCAQIRAAREASVLSLVRARIGEFERLRRREIEVTPAQLQELKDDADVCYGRLAVLKGADYPSGPIMTDDGFLEQLEDLRRICVAMPARKAVTDGTYERLRERLLRANPYFVPLAVIDSEDEANCRLRYDDCAKTRDDRIAFVNRDFEQSAALFERHGRFARDLADAPKIASSSWTGEPNVRQQVIAIQRFAPVVLASLDELIAYQKLLIHNQEPEPAQLEAINQLRRLHAHIGALLSAVDSGRPFKALAKRVRKLGERLFSIRKSTQELLVNGVPVMGATTVTLGLVKGLEFISGFNLGETETAAIVTVAGGTYTALAVAQKVSAGKPGK